MNVCAHNRAPCWRALRPDLVCSFTFDDLASFSNISTRKAGHNSSLRFTLVPKCEIAGLEGQAAHSMAMKVEELRAVDYWASSVIRVPADFAMGVSIPLGISGQIE